VNATSDPGPSASNSSLGEHGSNSSHVSHRGPRAAKSIPDKRGLFATLLALGILAPLMSMSPWSLSAGLILGCGVCVTFEFALVKVPLRKLERDVHAGVSGATVLLDMKRELNSMLAACQFGITLTSLGLTLALEPAVEHALADYQQIAAYSVAIAMACGTLLHVTFGELVPKGFALVVPIRVLYLTAPFMRLFRWAAVPFIKTCNVVANFVVKSLTGKDPDIDTHEDNVDIDQALFYAARTGEIKPQQLRLMRNVLAFADRTVRGVMTPARKVIYLDIQRPWEANIQLADEHGYSRLPVVDGDPHNVIGYVRRADLLQAELRGRRDLKELVLPIERRPESAVLGRLDLFRGSPIIAVYDEHDSFTGLITAEDIVEQIVGEIYDETDDREEPEVVNLPDGSVRIDGATLLDIAGEALGLETVDEHEDVDTIGGLVLKLLGRQPRVADEVEIEDYVATVEGAKGFRISAIRFRRRMPQASEPADVESPGNSPEM
jgi:CBS domain containing-hemolysin-like protein